MKYSYGNRKKTYNITMLIKDSFSKLMHMVASLRETVPYANHSIKCNSSKTRMRAICKSLHKVQLIEN